MILSTNILLVGIVVSLRQLLEDEDATVRIKTTEALQVMAGINLEGNASD